MVRDWVCYNDVLVWEVSFFFSRRLLDSLRRFDVGGGRVGRPPYPNSLIIFLALIRAYFRLPYRHTEGLARMLSKVLDITVPDYSTLNRRVRRLTIPVDLNPSNKFYELSIDSTGYKVSNRGDWMRERWKRRRGYVKLHVAVDIKSKKVVSLEVTDESVGDSKMFKPLVEKASEKGVVAKVYYA
ncbi:MAG: transposase [Nitrososphaeria archaeon]